MKTTSPFTLGVSGGSASGKSTFARELAKTLDGYSVRIFNQDAYFQANFPGGEQHPGALTHNRPESVRWERLVGDLDAVLTATGDDRHDLVIVEGHLIFDCEALRNRFDLAIYLEADPHERVLRRLERHLESGSTDLTEPIAWYRKDVISNYWEFTATTRKYADLVISTDRDWSRSLAVVSAGIRSSVTNRA